MKLGVARLARRTLAFYAVLVMACAGVLAFGLESIFGTSAASSTGVTRTVTVSRGDLQSAVTASGNIAPATSDDVDFEESGTLATVEVAVGDKVKAGQLLATLDPTTEEESLASARANLSSAEEQLSTAEQGGSSSQLAEDKASLTSAKLTLATDQQQLATDETALQDAEQQLRSDESLGCPAVSSSSTSSSGSTGSSSTSSSGSAGSGATTTAARTGTSGTEAVLLSDDTVAGDSGTSSTTTTTQVNAPTVSTLTASGIGLSTATLQGTVLSGGADTTYSFEYGTSTSYGSQTSSVDVGDGSATASVSAGIGDLAEGTTYDYRIVASNSMGTSYGSNQTFTTDAPATVTTGSASSETASTATVSGTVDPGGLDTTYYVEYGTRSGFGEHSAVVDAGSGTTAVDVTAVLRALRPDTSYVYRLVAVSAMGTVKGVTETFTTSERSCGEDRSTITSDQKTVAAEKITVEQEQQSIASTEAQDAASPTTIASDRSTVVSDEQTVAADEKLVDETTLRAPIGGTVTAVNDSVGATVSGGGSNSSSSSDDASSSSSSSSSTSSSTSSSSSSSSGFITIDDLGSLQVVAPFAEADASKIAVGDSATVTMAALTDTEVAGTVTAVSPTSTTSDDVVEFDETITLQDPPKTVKDGMTADVSVVTSTVQDALLVPSAAITTSGSTSTVTVLKGGKRTVTPVTLGVVGTSDTQILSGVTAGEVLVEPTTSLSSSSSSSSSTSSSSRSSSFSPTGGGLGGGFGGAPAGL